MKKAYLTLAALFAVLQFSYAQWPTSGTNIYNSNTGNVGIGTTNPTSKLSVSGVGGDLTSTTGNINGNVGVSVQNLNSNGNAQYSLKNSAGNYKAAFTLINALENNGHGALYIWDGVDNLLNLVNGKVGIGSTNPQSPFTVKGNSNWGSIKIIPTADNQETSLAFSSRASDTDNSNLWLLASNAWGVGSNFAIGHSSMSTPSITVGTNGDVGIGTTDPKGYRLAVNGAAIATSMKVKLQANWPDFVFLKEYKLPTLAEVKTYIDKNQHLPDMPSASEVQTNGLDLGEMNRLLLKKVEELTLYLIEQSESNKALQVKLSEMTERVKSLEVNYKPAK